MRALWQSASSRLGAFLMSCVVGVGGAPPAGSGGNAADLHRSPLAIANQHYRVVLDTSRPSIRLLENRRMGRYSTMLAPRAASPLFALTLREAEVRPGMQPRSWVLTSRDFSTASVKALCASGQTTATWDMSWGSGDPRLHVRLDVRSDRSMESLWTATLTANRELDATFTFPMLDGLHVGPRPQEVWYFHPRWCGLLNNVPVDLASVYGQYVRMQAMAAYHPSGAGKGKPAGIYVVTRDTTMMRKTYELVKRVSNAAPERLRDEYGFPFWSGFLAQEGIGLAVSWLRIALRAGRPFGLPPVVLGIGAGDWRDAQASYGRWARAWCPVHTGAVRDCFQHASFDLFSQPNCDAALAELDRHPRPDYMQFMVQRTHVNGEYGYRDDWGLVQLQRFVRECKRRSIVTNHYVEGYIAATDSHVWKEKGNAWGQMAGKQFQMAFANQCMWLGCPDWHQWLAGETTRLAGDLGLDSVYLDEVGFGTGDKCFSDNPHHGPGRLQPDGAMVGVRDLLRSVRASLDQVNPCIAIYTEGPAVDCLFPYLDGVEDYSCRQWNSLPGPYRIPVHFLRFIFPDFKFADIPEGTREEMDRQVRLCLFNGIGTCTGLASGDPAEWIERVHVVERESRDAFNDPRPQPLVPTLHERVYCNRFTAPNKTLFTLFNANDYPVSGHVLHLPAVSADVHWVDLLRCADLRLDSGAWGTRAVLSLAPGGVATVAALPARLRIRREAEHIWLTAPRPAGDERIVLARVDRSDIVREQRPLQTDTDGLSLANATEMGRYRAALKLYRHDILQDLLSLPDLATLDLGEAATSTGSIQTSDRDPRTVNGAKPGTYGFNWDDKERWVQFTWQAPQIFNVTELRCTDSVYSPQIYSYLTSQDGREWKAIAEVNREGKPEFNAKDVLPPVTTRFFRLQIRRGGPWGDHTEIVRWRIYCRPAEEPRPAAD